MSLARRLGGDGTSLQVLIQKRDDVLACWNPGWGEYSQIPPPRTFPHGVRGINIRTMTTESNNKLKYPHYYALVGESEVHLTSETRDNLASDVLVLLKPPTHDNKDFILVLQNDEQKQAYLKFGKDIIYMDATHRFNRYVCCNTSCKNHQIHI